MLRRLIESSVKLGQCYRSSFRDSGISGVHRAFSTLKTSDSRLSMFWSHNNLPVLADCSKNIGPLHNCFGFRHLVLPKLNIKKNLSCNSYSLSSHCRRENSYIFQWGSNKIAQCFSTWRPTGYGQRRTFWTGMPNGTEMTYILIGANLGVFVAWNILSPRTMLSHFTISDHNLRAGRWYTIVTSAFSHRDTSHIFTNMLGLYFFGTEIGRLFGGQYLLALYLAGGVAGSLSHVIYIRYILPELERRRGTWYLSHLDHPALGASGAVNSIVLLDCLLFPTRIIYLNLILPIPAIILGIGFVLKDLYGVSEMNSKVGHAAHLGGAAIGIVAWILKCL